MPRKPFPSGLLPYLTKPTGDNFPGTTAQEHSYLGICADICINTGSDLRMSEVSAKESLLALAWGFPVLALKSLINYSAVIMRSQEIRQGQNMPNHRPLSKLLQFANEGTCLHQRSL